MTLIFIGVDLEDRGLYSEAGEKGDITLAQTGRRTTPLTMGVFAVETDKQRWEWRHLLLAVEQRIVLSRKFPGMLAEELSDYLYYRSSGRIGSLMTLINRGCQRAARTGAERLDERLLEHVKLDAAAERARKPLELEFKHGTMTTKPTGPPPPSGASPVAASG